LLYLAQVTVEYGTTGGDQRIAVMYDLDWIRAKDDIEELFGKGTIIAGDGKDAFPRLPLYAYFTSLSVGGEPFDFQLAGLHLKSQRGGVKVSAGWLLSGLPRGWLGKHP
jgi:hypothetical protein